MSHHRLRWFTLSALIATLSVIGASAAFAYSSFVVESVSPSPFYPSQGQVTTITYTVPTTSSYRIAVRNSAGTEVCQLVNYVGQPAGRYTRNWNGKDRYGRIVPAGTYTVMVQGKAYNGTPINTGYRTVLVGTTAPTPIPEPSPTPTPTPTPTTGIEQGQLIEGAARANFDWFKSGYKFAVTFKAPKSGTIVEASVPWRTTTPGYGSGTLGVYTWELRSNGTNNLPSTTILKSVTGLRASAQTTSGDSPFYVPITATLTAGTVYHFVIYNTDPNRSVNWSSLNTVMSRIYPWDPYTTPGARGSAAPNGSNTFTPWSSNSDIWNVGGGNTKNGSHIALILKWSDGSITGDPYWSSAMSNPVNISSTQHAGQLMVWNRPTATVSTVGVPLMGSGTVTYHLETASGATLATGPMSGTSSTSYPVWKYATLPTKVTLTQGQTYRLWFSASSTMTQYPVYGPTSPSSWYNASWGGPQSCVIRRSSGGSWSSTPTQDLSFSLK